MELEYIIRLIREVSDSTLTGFHLEEGNLRLSLEKFPEGAFLKKGIDDGERTEESPTAPKAEVFRKESSQIDGVFAQEMKEPTALSERQEESVVSNALKPEKIEIVKSPLVGTFYTSPSPEEVAFVKRGDPVKKGQVIGIIEAMKLMNEIESEFDGVVEEVLVQNEQMVEYGQELFRIRLSE